MNTPEEQQFFDWFNGLSPAEQQQFQSTYGTGSGVPTTPAPAPAAPVPDITAPTTTPGTAINNSAVFQSIAADLTAAGLGSLFTVSADGTPSGWLWDQITAGNDTEAELQTALEQTQAYQSRYGIITRLRARAASGEPVHVPTMEDVRNYEVAGRELFQQAGLPPWMYDTNDDMQQLMEKGIGLPELQQRVGAAWERVAHSDPHVLAAFEDYYGIQGEAALASMFLDPNYTLAALDRTSRAAFTGGMGQAVGLKLDRALSERIADLPTTEAGIVESLNNVSELQGRGLFNEGISEVTDLTAEQTGIDAVVFGGGAALSAIERRTLERQANSRSSAGGAALTQAGLTGTTSS